MGNYIAFLRSIYLYRKNKMKKENHRDTYLKFHACVYTGAYHKTKNQFVSSNEITGYWVKKNNHALVKNKFIRLIKFISLAKQHRQNNKL